MTRRDSCSLLEKCALLLFVIAAYSVTADQACDPNKCPGPLRYYKNLGCKPVYQNESDCCAIRYDCDHILSRSKEKCYVNGYEYSISEKLKEEDRNPCDYDCICSKGSDGVASFQCDIIDCPTPEPETSNCYYQNSPDKCCPGPRVCLDNIKDRPKCTVGDTIYYDGQNFKVDSDPDLNCYCQKGYTGQNVEPFCKKPNHPYCTPSFSNAHQIHKNCAPVFYSSQSPQTSCHLAMRCQNARDTVIHKHNEIKLGEKDETMMCKFGYLKMYLGDELSQATHYTSVCVKCLCEVPPVPTCQRLPDKDCDITKYGSF